MQADVHAVLLIALTVAALAALALFKRRIPTSRQFVIAFALASFGTVAAPTFNHHLCREGEPRTQWLILGPCLLLILVFVKSAAWRRILGTVVFVGMLGLSCHFTEFVHTPGWTGNPDWDGGNSLARRGLHQVISAVAKDMEDPQVEYPAGWLRDLPVWDGINERLGDSHRPVYRRQLERAWHTWLTGLYRYTKIRQDYWYPGGPFAEAGPRTELRDRTPP